MISRQTYFYFPISMFALSWFIVLAVYKFSPINLYPVADRTLIFIIISLVSVISGYFLYRIYFIEANNPQMIKRTVVQPIEFNYSKFFILSLVLNMIILVSLIIFTKLIAEERGGIVNYFANPIMSRRLIVEGTKLKGWNLPQAIASYGVSLVVIGNMIGGILFTSEKKLHKIYSFFPLLLGVAFSIVNFSRYALITVTLHWAFAIFFTTYFLNGKSKKKNLQQLFIMILVLILLFLAVSYVLVNLRQFTDSESQIEKKYIQQIQYYISGNVVGFDQYLKQDLPYLWGKGLSRTILKWFSRIGLVDKSSVLETKYNFVKISPVLVGNVYSYIRPLYEDFGVYGLLIFSLLFGGISAAVTNALLTGFNLIRLYLVVAITFAMFMSFFSFHFIYISKILYDVIALFILSRMLQLYKPVSK